MEKDEGSSGEGQSPRVEKDEGPEAETLSRLLIVVEGPNYLEGPCLFLSFYSDTLYVLVFVFNKKNFWAF